MQGGYPIELTQSVNVIRVTQLAPVLGSASFYGGWTLAPNYHTSLTCAGNGSLGPFTRDAPKCRVMCIRLSLGCFSWGLTNPQSFHLPDRAPTPKSRRPCSLVLSSVVPRLSYSQMDSARVFLGGDESCLCSCFYPALIRVP